MPGLLLLLLGLTQRERWLREGGRAELTERERERERDCEITLEAEVGLTTAAAVTAATVVTAAATKITFLHKIDSHKRFFSFRMSKWNF